MKNIQIIIISGILYSLTVSCDNSNISSNIRVIEIDNTTIADSVDLTKFVDTIILTQLDELKSEPIGDVFRLLISDTCYIIYDRLVTKKVFLYNKQGKYLKTIFSVGPGPDQTLQINDCWLTKSKQLEIYDYSLRRIYRFDSRYRLTESIKTDSHFLIDDMIQIPDTRNYIGYSGYNVNPVNGDKYYKVLFFNEKMKIINTALPISKEVAGTNIPAFRDHFHVWNDSLIFYEAFNNTIYDVVNNSLSERYILKYKANNIPDDYLVKVIKKNLSLFKSMSLSSRDLKQKNELLQKHTSFGGQWLEGEKYIYLSSKQGGSYFFSLYNKDKCMTEFSARSYLVKEEYDMFIPFLEYYDIYKKEFVGVLLGENLARFIRNNSKIIDRETISAETYYLIRLKLKRISIL